MEKGNLGLLQINTTKQFFLLLALFLASNTEVCCQSINESLLGKWELQGNKDQINYPILYFNADSSAIFKSKADTIYRFKYSIKEDQLSLKGYDNSVTKWRIINLSPKELIFECLFENKTKQVYKRARDK